jgi:hypothetical protein
MQLAFALSADSKTKSGFTTILLGKSKCQA